MRDAGLQVPEAEATALKASLAAATAEIDKLNQQCLRAEEQRDLLSTELDAVRTQLVEAEVRRGA